MRMNETNPNNECIVDLQDVCFAYQDASVLHNVNCKIHAGEFIGVIGPNGGGKTTLLKLIMGFLAPTNGKVVLFGQSPKNVFQKIAYVPQTTRFDKQFPISVMEVVLLGRLSHLPWYGIYSSADKKAAVEALEKVGLANFADRSFGTLSGGQAQRVLIARALASNPSLLLLDEPTASVDANAQAEIYALLNKLKGNITILMVTHDLNVAIEHVNKLICVQRTAAMMTPQEVCEHFAMGLYHTPLITGIKTHIKIPNR